MYSPFTAMGARRGYSTKFWKKKIEAFEMWCLRMMGKFKWSDLISNEKILKILKTKRWLLSSIQQRKLKYYGHIKRKDNILTTIMEGRMQGKRPQGRPRNTWFADIKEWTGRKGEVCTRLAADRNLWGVISRQPSSRRWHLQVIQVMSWMWGFQFLPEMHALVPSQA